MRVIIIAAAILMGLVGATQAECYHTLKEALTHGRSVRVKGECFYNIGKHTERKVVQIARETARRPIPEFKPPSATGAAHALPAAWPKALAKTPAWETDFQWMVKSPLPLTQAFAELGL